MDVMLQRCMGQLSVAWGCQHTNWRAANADNCEQRVCERRTVPAAVITICLLLQPAYVLAAHTTLYVPLLAPPALTTVTLPCALLCEGFGVSTYLLAALIDDM
jgi:hypothetical protein